MRLTTRLVCSPAIECLDGRHKFILFANAIPMPRKLCAQAVSQALLLRADQCVEHRLGIANDFGGHGKARDVHGFQHLGLGDA